MVWYSHLLKNFPQFAVIHIVNGLDIASKAEIDVFLEVFFDYPKDVGNLISGSSTFLKYITNIYICILKYLYFMANCTLHSIFLICCLTLCFENSKKSNLL